MEESMQDEYGAAFEAAIQEFCSSINETHRGQISATTAEQVKIDLIVLQRDQDITKTLRDLSRLKSLIEALEEVCEVYNAVGMRIDSFSKYIWWPLRLIIKYVKQEPRALEHLLERTEKLGRKLPKLRPHEQQFLDHPELKPCLEWIYRDLLRYYADVIKLFEARNWQTTFVANWKDHERSFDYFLESLDHSRTLILTLQNSIQMYRHLQDIGQRLNDHVLNSARDRVRLHEMGHSQEIDRKHQQFIRVIRWVQSPGPPDLERARYDAARQVWSQFPETCQWILEVERVHDLISAEVPAQSMVWIHGPKGTGKTTLASKVIHHLAETKKHAKTSYYFCSEDDRDRGEPELLRIYKSLLRQLLGHNQNLLPTMHERTMNGMVETLADESQAQSLLKSFCALDMKQFIVIDGIDELQEESRGHLLSFLQFVVNECDLYDPGKVRVFLIGVDSADMQTALRHSDGNIVECCIPLERVQKDIETFVKQTAAKLKDKHFLKPEQVTAAESMICRRSRGVFLYAALMLDNLIEQPNAAYVLEELNKTSPPETLNEVYQSIFDRLKRDSHKNMWIEATKVFGWLACAKRPLKLYELQAVVSATDDYRQLVLRSEARLSEDVRRLCGRLVVVRGEHVEFIHQTAKEFVMTGASFDRGVLECDRALFCMSYLSKGWFSRSINPEARLFYAKKGYYAFQDYALAAWDEHLQTMLQRSIDVLCGSGNEHAEFRGSALHILRVFHDKFKGEFENEPRDSQVQEQAERQCEGFKQQPFYAQLVSILAFAIRHHRKALKERNAVSLEELREALAQNREVLQKAILEDDATSDGNPDTIEKLYGKRVYKCTRTMCVFFYEGFEDESALERHSARHDRPFICPFDSCTMQQFGFTSNNELNRHLRRYHESDNPDAFPQPRSQNSRATHACPDCSMVFTRPRALKDHRNAVHLGRKPHACRVCDRHFVRKNDMLRHERSVCAGRRR